MGISTKRYLPPNGTAGLQRTLVSGSRRVPRPPPIIMQITFDGRHIGNFLSLDDKAPLGLRTAIKSNLVYKKMHSTASFIDATAKGKG